MPDFLKFLPKPLARFGYVSLLAFGLSGLSAQQSQAFETPDILVLGDSQITFGSGPSFLSFFENLKQNCAKTEQDKDVLTQLGQRVAVIGVRSTSLGTWARRTKGGKGPICDVDPKWKVNAGSYGTVNRTKNIYVQIGQGKNYQFCKPGQSAFETMFRKDYYNPKLLVMTFLGNSSQTWADDPAAALSDVKAATEQLPPGMPCIFMTTAPTYQKSVVDMRHRAQANLKRAFDKTGNRCSFVEGYTPQTIKANLGVKSHFRRKKNGSVKDPFHPNKAAAKQFFSIQKQQICNAILHELRGLD
ncbi:SGNH/GDSL hydrolase family protein [Aliiroseovarius sp. 2305UL8-7]|uniref:SGNH/GDSL hydrolase family protein n=1 Tax=Aliiroseovarius conchicola TaxID=3121637 RepID=UPI0035292EB1